MVDNIDFVKKDDKTWEAGFVSYGPGVVQVKRSDIAPLSIRANIPGMEPIVIYVIQTEDSIFRLEIPEGMEVTMISWSEVLEAKFFTE